MNFLIKVLTVVIVLVVSKVVYTKYDTLTTQEYSTYKISDLPAYSVNQNFEPNEGASLVSLRNSKGQIFCSGAVISDDYVLTAGHCLMNHDSFIPGISTEEITIVDAFDRIISTGAAAAALNQRADVGLVKGNFKQFTKSRIMLQAMMLAQFIGAAVNCGFPRGEGAACFVTGQFTTHGDALLAPGLMFFGMSGGPVYNIVTETIFAVNTAVSDGIIVSPIVGLFAMFEIKVTN